MSEDRAPTEMEVAKVVREVVNVDERKAPGAVRRAMDVVRGLAPTRRANLEKRNGRIALLRRAYDTGFEDGRGSVRGVLRDLMGGEADGDE